LIKFFKRRQKDQVPQSYQPMLEASEVIDLFSRMTLHQQAALLRLTSRNLMIDFDGEFHMGYDFDWNVNGAMIVASPSEPDYVPQLTETSDPT
jgi:hypothetical protein|tara:strand:+ start:1037 stop:1315 length:279 start_codon:yes stop_codon:yes gene_type:complete